LAKSVWGEIFNFGGLLYLEYAKTAEIKIKIKAMNIAGF